MSTGKQWLLVGLACVVFLAQELPLLHTRWGADENFTSIPATTLVNEGRFRLPIYASDKTQETVNQQIWGYPPAMPLLLQVPFRLFGIGPVQARSVTVLGGLGVIVMVFLLARQWVSPAAGVVASLLVAMDNMVWLAGRCVRPDIYVAFLILAAFWIYQLSRERNSRWLAFNAGLCIGISFSFHPNTLAAAAAIGLMFLIDLRGRVWRDARPWLYAVGVIVAVLPYWLWMHSDALHTESWTLAYGIRAKTTFMENLRREFLGRYGDFIQFPLRLHVALLIVASIVTLWFKNRRLLSRLAVIILPYMLLWLYAYNKNVRYFVILTPLFAIAVAGAAVSFSPGQLRGWAVTTVLILYGCSQMLGNYYLMYKDRGADYPKMTRDLCAVVPPGASVYAAIDLWMALHDRQFYGYERTPFEYAVANLKPTYMILNDRTMKGGWRGHYGDEYAELRTKANAYVREHGELVGRLPYQFYGDLEVYRVTYPEKQ